MRFKSLMAASAVALLGAGLVAARPVAAASAPDWTVYHQNPIGAGVYNHPINLANAHEAWTSPNLTGQLFGEPLVSAGDVYVATTADVVYALHASDGTVAWSTTVGTPVLATSLPCGNVKPTVGIVGTPVIDATRHEIYAVADEEISGAASHHLVGLDTTTGAILLDQNVDPPGSTPTAQLQRTGLNLTSGRVVFGMGGNSGDCSTYHGWVISVPEAGGTPARYQVDAGASQGAVWMGGAALPVDAKGDVWVATGNGQTGTAKPLGGDSVIKLSPTMKQLDIFTPKSWSSDNVNDYDLGSASPAVLPNGHVVQVGKSSTAYVLNETHLGGIGGQQALIHPICGNTFDGGDAFIGSTIYLPCRNGTIKATVTNTLTVNWTTSMTKAGPPIVAGGTVWTIDQRGNLYGLNPSTGAITQTLSIGSVANHFPTASVGDGLLLAPATNTVVAFTGS